jgi:hypothetical protein
VRVTDNDILAPFPTHTARRHHGVDWHAREQQSLTVGERAAEG